MEAMTRSLAARVRERLAAGGIDAARDPAAVRALIERAIDRHVPDLLPAARAQIEADLMDDICGLGPLQVLMDDPSVEEIWINAASRVFVARGGVAELTSLILTDEDVRALVERMLHHSGRRLDLSSPFVDAMLAGGERLHVVIPPVTGSSWSVNIRKHIQRARTLEDLVAVEMVAAPMPSVAGCPCSFREELRRARRRCYAPWRASFRVRAASSPARRSSSWVWLTGTTLRCRLVRRVRRARGRSPCAISCASPCVCAPNT